MPCRLFCLSLLVFALPGCFSPTDAPSPPTSVTASPGATLLPKADDEVRIHFLNQGTGSCQIVECPGSDDVLVVDCGSLSNDGAMTFQQVQDYILPIVAGKRLRFALSHPDADHYNYVPRIFTSENLKKHSELETTFVSLTKGGLDGAGYDPKLQQWQDTHFPDPLTVQTWQERHITVGESEPQLQCNTMNARVLMVNYMKPKPRPDEVTDPNSQSMVLLLTTPKGKSIFLPGDATKGALVAAGSLPKVTLAVMSHHGSWQDQDSPNDPFITQQLLPDIAAVQAGIKHGHPTCYALTSFQNTVPRGSASKHRFDCTHRRSLSYIGEPTTQAIYNTHSNGTVVVTLSDRKGAESRVTCLSNGIDSISTTCALTN